MIVIGPFLSMIFYDELDEPALQRYFVTESRKGGRSIHSATTWKLPVVTPEGKLLAGV